MFIFYFITGLVSLAVWGIAVSFMFKGFAEKREERKKDMSNFLLKMRRSNYANEHYLDLHRKEILPCGCKPSGPLVTREHSCANLSGPAPLSNAYQTKNKRFFDDNDMYEDFKYTDSTTFNEFMQNRKNSEPAQFSNSCTSCNV